ncbi:MAG: AAA family ATPase [Myxococcales bacterium]|nr:AAA family ATPase [Myxococcales bacterium]
MKRKETEIIICVGTGGVGKTTVSAMLGLDCALKAQKTLIVTIDPAKRLLDALGLKKNSSSPEKVDVKKIFPSDSTGELYAFMPNLKQEWADFLSSSTKTSKTIHEISKNPFYQYMIDGLPGSSEIICAHTIHRLVRDGDYDVIILDTPPASNSVSFFDVPKKLIRVLEHRVFKFLMGQGKGAFSAITRKFAFFSGEILEKTFEKII